MTQLFNRYPLLWCAPISLIILIDQISKHWATQTLQLGERLTLTRYFDLVHVRNEGAAFSFLQDASGWQNGFFTVVGSAICIILIVVLLRSRAEPLLRGGLVLIIGGAIGNLIDRLRIGAVVDFIHIHWEQYYYPAFNLADSSITLAIAILIWREILICKRKNNAS